MFGLRERKREIMSLLDDVVFIIAQSGNMISTAVEKPALGSTKLIVAPYSSNMLRVIGSPSPIPWPNAGSTFTEDDSKGRNQRSPSRNFTRVPVFSTRTIVASRCLFPTARMPPLPHCSAHGLRKAGATIAANNGATSRQLMAIFGWDTLKEAERYTRNADQQRLPSIVLITAPHTRSSASIPPGATPPRCPLQVRRSSSPAA